MSDKKPNICSCGMELADEEDENIDTEQLSELHMALHRIAEYVEASENSAVREAFMRVLIVMLIEAKREAQ